MRRDYIASEKLQKQLTEYNNKPIVPGDIVDIDTKKVKAINDSNEVNITAVGSINDLSKFEVAIICLPTNLDKTENHLVDMLVYLCTDSDFIVIDDEGYELEYVSQVYDLINFYDEISEYKEYLLSLCTGYNIDGTPIDGITEGEYESYFNSRKEFFNAVTEFVENSPIDEIKSTEHFNSLPEESQNMILELFNVISQDIKEYNDTFKFLTNIFKDKYCIIGQTAASTTDIGAIPFERTYTNVCIHANIMNTILNKDFISYYPWYFGFIASFILSMFLLLLHEKSSSIQNLIGGISRLALISIFILLFVISHIYIPILTSVIIFNTVDYLAGAIYRYLISSREKKFITAVASSFANKDTVEQLRKNPELFKTEGEKKYIDDSQIVKSCKCDLTPGICDYKCCCDQDCTDQQIKKWNDDDTCINKGKFLFFLFFC